VYFFFSSRRRHTRFSRDWSSDVCSSDLITHDIGEAILLGDRVAIMRAGPESTIKETIEIALPCPRRRSGVEFGDLYERIHSSIRSEERRVGKEGRRRFSAKR